MHPLPLLLQVESGVDGRGKSMVQLSSSWGCPREDLLDDVLCSDDATELSAEELDDF
jgi:hypothetical protein